MTIKEALKFHPDAPILLSFVLKKDKAFLFANPKAKLNKRQTKTYKDLLNKRLGGWPAAYLTGRKEFYGLKFEVSPDVLIPRPETEMLVESALEFLKGKRGLKILDIGTGSGAIIIGIAKIIRNAELVSASQKKDPELNSGLRNFQHRYYASDVSAKALAIAKQNAGKHKVKISFKKGSLLEPWTGQRFDIIVANLPYGWKEWKNNSSAETAGLKFEPKEALFTGKNGLELYEKLFKQISSLRGVRSSDRTTKQSLPQAVFVEFDPRQTYDIKKLIRKLLPNGKLKIVKDLSGRNRVAAIYI